MKIVGTSARARNACTQTSNVRTCTQDLVNDREDRNRSAKGAALRVAFREEQERAIKRIRELKAVVRSVAGQIALLTSSESQSSETEYVDP